MDYYSTFNSFFSYIASYSIVLPLAAGIINYKRLTNVFRFLLWFIVFSTVYEVLMVYVLVNGFDRVILSRIFIIAEFLGFSIVYYLMLKPLLRKVIARITLGYMCLAAICIATGKPANLEANSILIVVAGSIITVYSIYFYDAYLQEKIGKLKSLFWLNTAIFIYFSFSTFIFIFNQYFQKYLIAGNQLVWFFHSAINIFFNLLIAYNLWRFRIQTDCSSPS